MMKKLLVLMMLVGPLVASQPGNIDDIAKWCVNGAATIEVVPLVVRLDGVGKTIEDFIATPVPGSVEGDTWLHLFVNAKNLAMVELLNKYVDSTSVYGVDWLRTNSSNESPLSILSEMPDCNFKSEALKFAGEYYRLSDDEEEEYPLYISGELYETKDEQSLDSDDDKGSSLEVPEDKQQEPVDSSQKPFAGLFNKDTLEPLNDSVREKITFQLLQTAETVSLKEVQKIAQEIGVDQFVTMKFNMAGKKPKKRDITCTWLDIFVGGERADIVQFLVESGANPQKEAAKGCPTPAQSAEQTNNPALIAAIKGEYKPETFVNKEKEEEGNVVRSADNRITVPEDTNDYGFEAILKYLDGNSPEGLPAIKEWVEHTQTNVYDIPFANQMTLGVYIQSCIEDAEQAQAYDRLERLWNVAALVGPYAKRDDKYPLFLLLCYAIDQHGAPKELLDGFKGKVTVPGKFHADSAGLNPAQKEFSDYLSANFSMDDSDEPDSDKKLHVTSYISKLLYGGIAATIVFLLWKYANPFNETKKTPQLGT